MKSKIIKCKSPYKIKADVIMTANGKRVYKPSIFKKIPKGVKVEIEEIINSSHQYVLQIKWVNKDNLEYLAYIYFANKTEAKNQGWLNESYNRT